MTSWQTAFWREIRVTGIAEEVEEAVLGECGVAAVLSDRFGGAAGAIGLVGSIDEWPLDPAVVTSLRSAARSVSRELGAASWPPHGEAPRVSEMGTRRRRPRPA